MSASLDVRQAVSEANGVFRRFPVQVTLPAVLMGLASYAIDARLNSGEHLRLLIILPVALGLFWLNSFVEVVVSAMYLRARDGTEPGGEQVGEALHYRGFASLIWGLILRYLGWGLLAGAIVAIGGIVVFGLMTIVASISSRTSGIGAVAGGIGTVAHGVGIGIGAVIAALILCRYTFVFPMFAIAHASGPGFLDGCVGRTKQVWKTAVLVMVAGFAPSAALAGILLLAWKHLTLPHGVHIAVELVVGLLTGCFAAWFILVKTGLALQLVSAQSPP